MSEIERMLLEQHAVEYEFSGRIQDVPTWIRVSHALPGIEGCGIVRHYGHPWVDAVNAGLELAARPALLAERQHGPGYVWVPFSPTGLVESCDAFCVRDFDDQRSAIELALRILAGTVAVEDLTADTWPPVDPAF